MKKVQALFGIFLMLPILLIGQTDTLVQLPVIEVQKPSIRQNPIGLNSQTWNEGMITGSTATNLADLLQRESNLYIKSYGGNSLATTSVRGASAGQTLILWNGLPIQSPMLGLLDLSLIPTLSAEKVQVQKGGSSALWGSGAVGGTIRLDNTIDFDNAWSGFVDTRLGAFGLWQQQAQFQMGNRKFQSRTKFSHQQGDNDFTYQIAPDLPERKQTNARFDQQHFLQDLYWKIHPNQNLSAHFWYLQSNRELPPTTTQNSSEARQSDWTTRLMLNWQLNQDKWIYQLKAARFSEHIRYEDPTTLLDAPSRFTTWMAEGEMQHSLSDRQKLTFGMIQFHTTAEADGYTAPVQENRIDGFFSYRLQGRQYGIQASLRQSIINNKYSPIVPSLGLDYRPDPQWRFHFQFSRNYRWPTLNDRYWIPGGNPNLRAEEGWSQELGLSWQVVHAAHELKLQATGYNRQINDWILWAPLEGQAFWSANNIAKVWSRGIETSVNYAWEKKDWQLDANISYDYIRSTNQIGLRLPRIEKGEQLLYTPIHQGFMDFNIAWKTLAINYRQQFTGTAKGVNETIPAFTTARLQVRYRWSWHGQSFSAFVAFHNLWDVSYQVIERRPMPGRHGQIGLRINFKPKK